MQTRDKHKLPAAEFIFLAGLMGLYFATRLTGLTLLPIFTDEAMYIHIAQIIDSNWENLFLTKVNAFKPLFIWIVATYQNFFPDPLLAGRLVSVAAGAASTLGIYWLGRELFSDRVGKVSAIIYLFCPYFIFFERLALMESLVNAFGIWTVWVSFRITKENELKIRSFVLLGTLLGLAFLTKSTALMFFPAPFVIFLLAKTYTKINFLKFLSGTIFLVLLINLPYFLTDQVIGFNNRHPIFSSTNFYIPIETLVGFPIDIWGRNIWTIYVYFMIYLTFPLFLVIAFGIFYALLQKNKTGITLLLLFVIPASIIVLIGDRIFSRYYLIVIPPLIILSGWALVQLANYVSRRLNVLHSTWANILLAVLLIFMVSEGIVFSKNLSKDPFKAFFPKIDRYQYLTSQSSGHGVKEAAEFLITKSKAEPIYVLTSWSQGNPQDGIMVYLWGQPKINTIPALWWPGEKKLFPQGETFPVFPSKYQSIKPGTGNTADLKNVFFIMPLEATDYKKEVLENNPGWKRVWQLSKPDGKSNIEIYQYKNLN
ncbi:MAG: hypothetical protein HN649_10250 [Nitrospina sp.]|jgi:4-amino-4-deoxy-L-arabinose transferase-like glycosyltransferase|nr:hypothetical protein [Nitrospina sp.]